MNLEPQDKYFIAFIKEWTRANNKSIVCKLSDRESEYDTYSLYIEGQYIGCVSFDNEDLQDLENEENAKDMVLVNFMYEILRKLF